MQPIFRHIKSFYDREFNIFYLMMVALMLAILIYLNYWHGLEKNYISSNKSWWLTLLRYYLLYLIPFAIAFLLQPLFYKNCNYFSSKWFWVILLLAPLLFSFRVNFNFHKPLVLQYLPNGEQQFYLLSINWVIKALVLIIPIAGIWWLKDSSSQPLYGFKVVNHWQPYFIMLLIMLPLIGWASTQRDFLSMYPKAVALQDIPIKTWTDKWRYLLFESCYAIDFFSIEFFFRGFLVLSLLQICDTKCIIPIACFYCSIHLGKPMAEAISSFWGGLLLGIVSYSTGSIWGGLIVHIGIAWLMEIGGWAGNIRLKIR